MARLLVNKGANPNMKNKLGKTALEIATDCEKREVRSYLDRRTSVKPERSMQCLIICCNYTVVKFVMFLSKSS